MIDITFIRENPERFERIMKSRNAEFFSDDIFWEDWAWLAS